MNGPKWLHEVNPNSCISSREFAKIIGIGTCNGVMQRLKDGKLPPPDWIRKSRRDGHPVAGYYWKIKTVLRWLETAQEVVIEKDGEIRTKLV